MTRTVHKSSYWRHRGIVHQGPSLLRCESYLCILDMSSIGYILCRYFFPVQFAFLFLSRVPVFLIVSFKNRSFVLWGLTQNFSFTVHVFCDLSKNTYLTHNHKPFSSVSSFMVLVQFWLHVEPSQFCVVLSMSLSSFDLHVDIQLSQHHLLKNLFFLH